MRRFRRKIYDELLDWKSKHSRDYALLIEGARRVGKTTIVKEFAKNEYRSFLFIDLGENPHNVRKILEDYSGDYDAMFSALQILFDVKLYAHESLIIFDEVQMFPFARQMVKYLVEYGKYPVIETGSLISLRQNVDTIVIPSEERKIAMHPMDFEEYLWAKGKDMLVPLLREHFEGRVPLGDALHRAVMREYATYMAVGGMPQVVQKYVSGEDFESIDVQKQIILDLYRDDVMKIRGNMGTKVLNVLMQIPQQLSMHGKRFRPGDVAKDSRTREYLASFRWLEEQRIANICYACTDPGPAPDLHMDCNRLKIYLLDTGLLVTLQFRQNTADRKELYGALINGDLGVNNGMLFENAVAQEMVSKGIRPVFFEFDSEDSVRRQEIDFLISDGRKVIPVEQKSSRSGSHRSLDRYLTKYADRSDSAFVIHTKDLRTDGQITYIPVYMTMFVRSLPHVDKYPRTSRARWSAMEGKVRQAVIMVGGKGTRLRPLTNNAPKPALPILDKPCVGYFVDSLAQAGVEEIYFACGFKSDLVRSQIGDGDGKTRIIYSDEDVPMGTGGAIKLLEDRLDDVFIAINGDNYMDIDFRAQARLHERSGADITISLSVTDNPCEAGIVRLDADGRVTEIKEKPKPEEVFSNIINSGVYVINRDVLRFIPEGKMYDISKELFPYLLANGYRIQGYEEPGHWMDIGRPKDFLKANLMTAEKLYRGHDWSGQCVGCTVGGSSYLGKGTACGSSVLESQVLSAGCKVSGSELRNMLALPGCTLKDSRIEDTILGKDCVVEGCTLKGCLLEDGTVLKGGSYEGRTFQEHPPADR